MGPGFASSADAGTHGVASRTIVFHIYAVSNVKKGPQVIECLQQRFAVLSPFRRCHRREVPEAAEGAGEGEVGCPVSQRTKRRAGLPRTAPPRGVVRPGWPAEHSLVGGVGCATSNRYM